MTPSELKRRAQSFADELSHLLTATLPGGVTLAAEAIEERVVIATDPALTLFVNGQPLGALEVVYRCQLDSRGTWLAIEESKFAVAAQLDRTPIFRFEYVRKPIGDLPGAHLQIHAHRGALSHLLSQAGHDAAHDISKLHIPVGGARFRPCLEDVVEFLVVECRFDALHGWRQAVEEGRARWRRTHLRATIRDLPATAIEALTSLGYSVEPPEDSDSEDGVKALRRW